MTDTPWTPGPWYIAALDDQEEATEFDILAPDGEEEPWHIAKTYGNIDGEKANARLIAAAPEMAEALANMVEIVDFVERRYGGRINPPTVDNARALLARIKVETP